MKIVEQSHRIQFCDNLSEQRIEEAGRVAYKSEDKIDADSATSFVESIRKHGAVLEFADLNVRFVTDRGVSHELVRHRMASFVQESTRYCNYSAEKFGRELTFVRPCWITLEAIEEAALTDWNFNWKGMTRAHRWYKSSSLCEAAYLESIEAGESPQQARQVLNNSLKTEIVVKANFREWRHIFQLRAVERAAHPQMRALMIPLYQEMRAKFPSVFDLGNVEA